MKPDGTLQAMERKVYRSYYQDGLLDLFLGVMLAQFAIAPLLSVWGMGDFWSSAIWLPVYLAALLGMHWAKRRIVEPRLGQVKYSPERRAKIRYFTTGAVALGVIMFAAGLIVFIKGDLRVSEWTFPATVATGLFLAFFILGMWIRAARFILYGIWTSFASLAGEMLFRKALATHHGFPLAFGTSSLLFVGSGIVLFLRFLKRYPSPNPEENHG
jgi:hypothetical protein